MENRDLPPMGSVISQNITPLFYDLSSDETVNVMLYLLDNTFASGDQPFLWLVYHRLPGYIGDDKLSEVIGTWNDLTMSHEHGELSLTIDLGVDGLYNVLCLDWDKVSCQGKIQLSNPELISERFNTNEMIQFLSLIKDYAYDVEGDGPSGPHHV